MSGASKFPFPHVLAAALIAMLVASGLNLAARCYAQGASSRQSPPASGENEIHGKRIAEAHCAGCHGADGNSTDPNTPKLAGQDASYLLNQLRDFKSGARKSDVMSGPASAITDAQAEELADYYSEQTVKPDTAKNAGLAEAGAEIFAQRMSGSPSCAACHSQDGYEPMGSMMGGGGMMGGMGHRGMMGFAQNAPKLDGQHAAYVLRQLDGFASGTRSGTVMGRIAASLSEQDREAVAEYISSLRR